METTLNGIELFPAFYFLSHRLHVSYHALVAATGYQHQAFVFYVEHEGLLSENAKDDGNIERHEGNSWIKHVDLARIEHSDLTFMWVGIFYIGFGE